MWWLLIAKIRRGHMVTKAHHPHLCLVSVIDRLDHPFCMWPTVCGRWWSRWILRILLLGHCWGTTSDSSDAVGSKSKCEPPFCRALCSSFWQAVANSDAFVFLFFCFLFFVFGSSANALRLSATQSQRHCWLAQKSSDTHTCRHTNTHTHTHTKRNGAKL